jgi:UDP-glucose 4-epimerase
MIVVIGASGFIGTYLVDELVAQGRRVFATGTSPSSRDYFAGRGIPFAQVDMGREADMAKLPQEGVDAVVLLASLLPVNDSGCAPQRYLETNTIGALNVLEYCRTHKVKKIIYGTSHFDVAKLWDAGRAITEEDERSFSYTDDHAVYIVSKIAAVNLVEHYHQAHGVAGITFRLPGVYGFGPHTEIYINAGKVRILRTNLFIRKAMAGDPIEIWGDPSRGHDFVYVKDVVGGIIGALQSDRAGGLYNIASGVRTSLDEEVKTLVDVFCSPDRRSEIRYRPDKPNIPNTYLYDISKARRDFGYTIHYPFRRMMEDLKHEMACQRFPHLMGRQKKS